MSARSNYPMAVQPTEGLLKQLTRFPLWEVRDLSITKRTANYVVATFELVNKVRHTVKYWSLARARQRDVEEAIVELLEKKDNPPGKGIAVRSRAVKPGPLRAYDPERDSTF